METRITTGPSALASSSSDVKPWMRELHVAAPPPARRPGLGASADAPSAASDDVEALPPRGLVQSRETTDGASADLERPRVTTLFTSLAVPFQHFNWLARAGRIGQVPIAWPRSPLDLVHRGDRIRRAERRRCRQRRRGRASCGGQDSPATFVGGMIYSHVSLGRHSTHQARPRSGLSRASAIDRGGRRLRLPSRVHRHAERDWSVGPFSSEAAATGGRQDGEPGAAASRVDHLRSAACRGRLSMHRPVAPRPPSRSRRCHCGRSIGRVRASTIAPPHWCSVGQRLDHAPISDRRDEVAV